MSQAEGPVRTRTVVDPLARQLWRAARVCWGIGLPRYLATGRPVRLALGALREGFKTRSIYALHAICHPHRVALVDARRSVTYAEVSAESNGLANALLARHQVAAGVPVVLMLENCAEYVSAWFGLARLGAQAVHAGYRQTPAELHFLVSHSGARVVITSEQTYPVAAAVARDHPDLGLAIVVVTERESAFPGAASFAQLVASGSPRLSVSRGGRRASENVVYTSGTTGRPKGAVRDWAMYGLRELFRMLERVPFQMGERHLVVSPLYHSGGQVFIVLQATLASTIYLRPHFDPEDTLRTLSSAHVHSVFMVPTMVHRVTSLPDALFTENPLPDLRAMVSGAGEFPPLLRERAAARFGPRNVFDFYGATELGWVTLIRGDEMARKKASVGRPLSGQQVRILDEHGKEVPRGEVGRVYVRNEQTMNGYLRDSTATRAGQCQGWTTVEDLGYVDDEGYLFLVGRARDMVKSGGVNLYPAEIEEVLSRHPAVREVAVVGVPDPEWGEKLVAVVVPSGSGFEPADVEAFARPHLSGVKIPRRWELVEELPRNATGKVLKAELRQRYGTAAGPGDGGASTAL
jgi:fatty-acyl-CoA synthase